MMIILKAIVIQALFLAVYHTVLKRHRSFTFNRFFLLFGLLSVLCFSWIEIVIPHYVSVQSTGVAVPIIDNEDLTLLAAPSYDFDKLTALLLLSISISIFCYRWSPLMSLSMHHRLAHSPRGYEIRALFESQNPFSFWPRIYMTPTDYENPDYAMIIRHEEIHLAKLHSADILIGEVILALLWFSPLSWLYVRAIRSNHEYEVDQYFTQDSAILSDYVQLLHRSWTQQSPKITSNFDFATNKNRVVMLRSECNKLSWLVAAVIIMTVVTSLIFMTFSEKIIYIQGAAEQLNLHLSNPNRPSAEMFDCWKNEPGSYGVYFDCQRIVNSSIGSIKQEDIFHFNVERTPALPFANCVHLESENQVYNRLIASSDELGWHRQKLVPNHISGIKLNLKMAQTFWISIEEINVDNKN